MAGIRALKTPRWLTSRLVWPALPAGAIGRIWAGVQAQKGTRNVRDDAQCHALAAAGSGGPAGRRAAGGDAGPVGLLWHRGVFRNAAQRLARLLLTTIKA